MPNYPTKTPDRIAERPDLFEKYVAELVGALNKTYNRNVSKEEQDKIVEEMMAGFNRADIRSEGIGRERIKEAHARYDKQMADMLARGTRLYWPVSPFDSNFEREQQRDQYPDLVRKETISEFVDMIEKVQGHKQLMRPENNEFSVWQAEGNEIEHLRIFYRSTGVELSDEELAKKAQLLRLAVHTSVKKVEEARSEVGSKAELQK
jgi:hypothetical protein